MKLAALLVPVLVACAALGARAPWPPRRRRSATSSYSSSRRPPRRRRLSRSRTRCVALKGKIPGIVAVEHGVNNSPEKKNLGFTHVFLITFEDATARDAYLPHPEHQKFGALLGSLSVMEDVFVVDYEPTLSGGVSVGFGRATSELVKIVAVSSGSTLLRIQYNLKADG